MNFTRAFLKEQISKLNEKGLNVGAIYLGREESSSVVTFSRGSVPETPEAYLEQVLGYPVYLVDTHSYFNIVPVALVPEPFFP